MTNSVKMIIEKLKVDGVKFTVKGFDDYRRKEEFDTTKPEIEVGGYGYFPLIFEVNEFYAVGDEDNFSIHGGLRSMNIEKYGPTCIWLYTFDMLNNRTRGKIKYSDVTLLEKA